MKTILLAEDNEDEVYFMRRAWKNAPGLSSSKNPRTLKKPAGWALIPIWQSRGAWTSFPISPKRSIFTG
jgi:hypothetical protein